MPVLTLAPGGDLGHAGGVDAELESALYTLVARPASDSARSRLPFLYRLSRNAPSAAPARFNVCGNKRSAAAQLQADELGNCRIIHL